MYNRVPPFLFLQAPMLASGLAAGQKASADKDNCSKPGEKHQPTDLDTT